MSKKGAMPILFMTASQGRYVCDNGGKFMLQIYCYPIYNDLFCLHQEHTGGSKLLCNG